MVFLRNAGKSAIDFISTDRVEAIIQSVEKRIQVLHELALSHQPMDIADTVENDVEENIAEDYTPKMTM